MSMTHPRPLQSPGATVGGLCTAELFVVSSLRLWALPHATGNSGWYPDWRRGFDATCRIVAGTAQCALQIRPLQCGLVGDDEIRFLRMFGLLQRDRVFAAESMFSSRCPPSAVRLALPPARVFVTALCDQKLWLPCPHASAALGCSVVAAAHAPRRRH